MSSLEALVEQRASGPWQGGSGSGWGSGYGRGSCSAKESVVGQMENFVERLESSVGLSEESFVGSCVANSVLL